MRYKVLLFILILAISALPVEADETQDKIDALREKIEELTKQAEQYRGTVLEKRQQATTLKQQIDILNSQIRSLEAQINLTENRISSAGLEITSLEGRIFDAQQDIDFKKATIGSMIADLNDRDRQGLLHVFIKNPSISGFANEAQQSYLLNERLSLLLEEVKEEKALLETQKEQVQKKKSELEVLSEQQQSQRVSLSGTKNSKNKLLADTKGQESVYQKLLSEVEKQKAAFFSELQSLENNAVANGTVITHVTASAVPARGTKLFSYPIRDGYYLTQGYGMTNYARRGAYGGAIHNGIDLGSGCSDPIYSIGDGQVLASGFNSGFGNWVAIQHDAGGGIVSVYGHMVRGTPLRHGSRVTTDTVVGYEGTTGTSTGCHVHLSLYKDFFTYVNAKNDQLYFNYANGTLNPLDYLKK